jgi:hypothetical protein
MESSFEVFAFGSPPSFEMLPFDVLLIVFDRSFKSA